MQGMGLTMNRFRAGNANMFLSRIFSQTFADCSGCPVELYNSDGAVGAARAAGFGKKYYKQLRDCYRGMELIRLVEPDKKNTAQIKEIFYNWKQGIQDILKA
jgi:xylulokinase